LVQPGASADYELWAKDHILWGFKMLYEIG
jgi:hypothetical protein